MDPQVIINSIRYPVFNEVAAVVWSAQNNALELHTPQWREHGSVDRLVVDLDPGPGSGLMQCCEVALLVADYLAADGPHRLGGHKRFERNATVRAVPGSYACAGRDELRTIDGRGPRRETPGSGRQP